MMGGGGGLIYLIENLTTEWVELNEKKFYIIIAFKILTGVLK